ncbi:DNA-directed RNA polymerase subunit beta [uncultured Helcococcus sp.]|uniref:DNA-directed RNA polymerase subunit beta n=1 Tax=uncultured Helcococcus sp. TaxID=1072508 RepID=UPI0026075294|nr:DNA-directed RNA polymerase subunit beta [uncultured Helcococcus sp.]
MNNHTIMYGKRERESFSRIAEALELPNLLEIQKGSYKWFLKDGIKEVFDDISPILDHSGNILLQFLDYKFDEEPKYSEQESKDRDVTYSKKMRVNVRLIILEDGKPKEIKEQEVLIMDDFPLMTENGTFIINGAERVVVSQLVRSPGVYYSEDYDKNGKKTISSTVIPNRGAWIEYDTDAYGALTIRVDRTRKLPATTFMRALAFDTTDEIIDVFGESEVLSDTLEKEVSRNKDEALIEIYKKLKPGDPASVEAATSLLNNLFFDPKRYDLSKAGRYTFNKKLAIRNRIREKYAANDIIDEYGEILLNKDEFISLDKAIEIENAGINSVDIKLNPESEEITRVVGNNFVSIEVFDELKDLDLDLSALRISEKVHYPSMVDLIDKFTDDMSDKDKIKLLVDNRELISPNTVILDDLIASFSYQLNLYQGVGKIDDIDHLGNRRVRSVGELLQNQFRIGLSRMERVIRERMTTSDIDMLTPHNLINNRPVSAAIKEFFGSSQLSQFMDQTNPISELTHKRRLSALGPGGLSRDRAGYEVRDVHTSHYGRVCPIETPEGPNIGLITSLTTYGRINEYGFIETPYRKVDKGTGRVTDEIHYLTADEEDIYIKAQANEPLDENGYFINERVSSRGINGVNDLFLKEDIDYMDVSPQQIVSVGAALIPFLENDDATRALMGANMQRQAVPLLKAESPIIGTGIEHRAAKDSGVVVVAKSSGTVTYVGDERIEVRRDKADEFGAKVDEYSILKFKRANQGTTINQRPIVKVGDHVEAGDIIADGPSTDMGELALGKNILIAFMTWEGYNYEDAMLLSEKLVIDDVLTSVHIEEHTAEARETKLGPEDITRDIPSIGEDMRKNLDEDGIIRIGAEVQAGDILVGKVTPKGETELSPEERLLRAIFGEKAREVRDTSLRVPHGEAGVVVDIKHYSKSKGDELSPGINEVIRVYIATKRKISVGDKMCGRHGNKGVVSRIMPVEDMPFLPNGDPVQIVLNPLGVPSRMNIGQVLEVHLGLAAKKLGWRVATPVFDGASDKDIEETLEKAGYDKTGKIRLRDGRTGDEFENPVTVGYMYMLKLHHLVDEKIHARSTGPYSLVTQQPLGGKAQFGGQRFGEMEVWALEAYGAAHTLQEMMTVKSDDINGRVKTYEAVVKGENIPEPGTPESFKVLTKELQSLALNVTLLDENNQEVKLAENTEEIDDFRQVERMADEEKKDQVEQEEDQSFIK